MMKKLVIVGGGHAAFNLIDGLVRTGYSGHITVFHEETSLPYDRPCLSKEFLARNHSDDVPLLRLHSFYEDNNIQVIHGRVSRIHPLRRCIETDSGVEVEYDTLILAVGAAATNPFEQEGVLTLRDISDARRLKELLEKADSVGIIGAGYIGLEFASIAAEAGKQVKVFEKADRVLARSASKTLAEFLAVEHASHGVEILTGVGEISAEYDGESERFIVHSPNFGDFEFDLVLSGIGARPRTQLAKDAGLEINNGIVVDENLRTSDPHIYAIGDCASYPGPEGPQRPENIQTATDQGRYLANLVCGRNMDAYAAKPWFWSIQYGHKIQISGSSTQSTSDELLPNQGKTNSFSILRSAENRLLVVESVNDPKTHVRARSGKLSYEVLADSKH